MSDAMTLPSDLLVPTVATDAFQAAFVTSLDAMGLVGQGEGSPIRIYGLEKLRVGGQHIQVPVLERVASLESRRDLTSQSLVDTKKFGYRNDRGVLVNRKIGPISWTRSASDISGLSPQVFSTWFGVQAARLVLETVQQFAISAAMGSVQAVSASAHTKSVWAAAARTNLTTSLLAQIVAKMGDAMQNITAFVTRSEPHNDLVLAQLGAGYAGMGDVAAAGGVIQYLGRIKAIVDDAALTAADAGYDKYYALGLGASAMELEFIRPLEIYPIQTEVRAENVQFIVRGDYDFALRVPGMAFSAAVANPTAANLADSGNWTPTYGDHRECKIVLGEFNYSGN
jgi:hypothetical protein